MRFVVSIDDQDLKADEIEKAKAEGRYCGVSYNFAISIIQNFWRKHPGGDFVRAAYRVIKHEEIEAPAIGGVAYALWKPMHSYFTNVQKAADKMASSDIGSRLAEGQTVAGMDVILTGCDVNDMQLLVGKDAASGVKLKFKCKKSYGDSIENELWRYFDRLWHFYDSSYQTKEGELVDRKALMAAVPECFEVKAKVSGKVLHMNKEYGFVTISKATFSEPTVDSVKALTSKAYDAVEKIKGADKAAKVVKEKLGMMANFLSLLSNGIMPAPTASQKEFMKTTFIKDVEDKIAETGYKLSDDEQKTMDDFKKIAEA